MNRLTSKGDAAHPMFESLRFKHFEVSWAGPHPVQPGFCFGSEDGRLLFTDEKGAPRFGPGQGCISGEAINGVAYSDGWMAVSSRADVTLQSMPIGGAKKLEIVSIPHGAHGITVAPSGYFVAPLGRTGIMMLKPGSGPDHPVGVLTADKEGLYFYRVLALQGRRKNDLLVCATRQGGIGITERKWGDESYDMRIASFAGLDVVDVCSISPGAKSKSRAVAAVGRDGTLIFVRDVLRDSQPVTMKFDTVQGTAYRLLRKGEDLFLLTSRGLYGLRKLAGRFIKGNLLAKFTTQILAIPMEAVDANLINDRWLLVIMPDEVLKLDMERFQQNVKSLSEGGIEESSPRILTPDWQMYGIAQTPKQVLATA